MRRFAEAIGILVAMISRIEAEIQKPEPDTLKVFAKHLHTILLVELMVVCGYWGEDELFEPIDKNKIFNISNVNESMIKENFFIYMVKELSEILIEDLDKHTLTYKGYVLIEE